MTLRAPTISDAILEVLATAGRPLTTIDIAHAARVEPRQAGSALDRLFNAGKVQRSKSGGRSATVGFKVRSWRIAPVQNGARS